jgi:hypothetical protein
MLLPSPSYFGEEPRYFGEFKDEIAEECEVIVGVLGNGIVDVALCRILICVVRSFMRLYIHQIIPRTLQIVVLHGYALPGEGRISDVHVSLQQLLQFRFGFMRSPLGTRVDGDVRMLLKIRIVFAQLLDVVSRSFPIAVLAQFISHFFCSIG